MSWNGREPLVEWPEVDWAEMIDDSWQPIFPERPKTSSEFLAVRAVEQLEAGKTMRRSPRRIRRRADDDVSLTALRERERLLRDQQHGR